MLNCDDESLKNNTKSVPAILVVEDSALINNLVYNKFTECGYECEQAFDFAQAQALLHQYYFDFIILDLNLPDAFGEDLVEEVFALSSAKHDTKIIILTSETDIQSRENLFKIGILDYVLKDHFFENSLRSILHTITQLEKNRDATILIIDDSKMVTRHIEKVLHVRNYKTLSAINAKEAFEVLETRSFNLIVLDMELPDIHGLEFLQKIRLQERFDLLPIIAISGSNDAETVRKALKLGAGDYIKKPFNVEEFTLKIDRAVLMQKQSKEVLCKQQILNDYKEAVDRSTIVSKTDKRGIITYVNDKFCEISGYSQEELIGKPHNMIRHPDMAPQLFEELWETIKQKKSWTGIIKNLKKKW
jgi:DNA-binding response OmpR family regulator